jgi:hypothetical protein
MHLYIKVENGQPIDHPVFQEQLILAFNCIPENYEPFNRKYINPMCFRHNDPPIYQKIDGVWSDVLIPTDYYNSLSDYNKNKWSTQPMDPLDPNRYVWSNNQNKWIAIPEPPQDGKSYSFRIEMGIFDEYDPVTEKFISDGVPLNFQR